MKIYVVGSSKNKFLPLDNIREKFLIDQPHEGDNIDFLNPWYCELTGLYYLWKHVDDDIVGLEHYRRYFVNNKNQLLSENEIKNILKTNDIICINWNTSLKKPLFSRFGDNEINRNDLMKVLYTICGSNKEQFNNFKKFLSATQHFQFNMFICKKILINEYCEWMFNIMNKCFLEFNINTFQKRSIGYITEIVLFPYWLYSKQLKVKNVKIKYCPNNKK